MIVAKTGTAELDRLNALLSWWGIPNLNDTEHIDGRMKRLQAFAANLQKAYGDEYCRQIEGAFTANQRLVFSLQAFLRCRQPQELIPIEIGIWMTVLERVSQQAAAWTDLTQKIQGCCAALVSGDEVEARQEARATESIDRTDPQ